jgi:hypothetical protein
MSPWVTRTAPPVQVQMIHLGEVWIMVPFHENRFANDMVAKTGEVGG